MRFFSLKENIRDYSVEEINSFLAENLLDSGFFINCRDEYAS